MYNLWLEKCGCYILVSVGTSGKVHNFGFAQNEICMFVVGLVYNRLLPLNRLFQETNPISLCYIH